MQLNPYIYFNGRCQEALDFYEAALGAKVVFKMTYGESPAADKCSKESLDKIMHARLDVGGSVIMMSDAPESRYSTPQGFSISLNLQDPVESELVYKELSAGGKIQMPMEETFWAQRFAMFTDKFGTPWMINCEKTA
jgi:PhnB protein